MINCIFAPPQRCTQILNSIRHPIIPLRYSHNHCMTNNSIHNNNQHNITSSLHATHTNPCIRFGSSVPSSTNSLQSNVIDTIKSFQHPLTKQSIATHDVIESINIDIQNNTLSLQLPLDDSYRTIKQSIINSIKQHIPQLTTIKVSLLPDHKSDQASTLASQHKQSAAGLSRVKHIIAVSSCKGGVGKSTVAVNLAYSIQQQGKTAGIFDADIYGPSLPTLVNPTDTVLRENVSNKLISPLEYHNVKLMSYGYVRAQQQRSGSVLMRGPMVSQVITQLLNDTDWAELDYLIIDMPPGTGDIAITLTQSLKLTSSIVVTTPQQLSYIDVIKGLDMFYKVYVPVVAVVENMSYYICDNCDSKHYIFGSGHLSELQSQFGIEHIYQIPLQSNIAKQSDRGVPVVLDRNNESTQQIRDIYSGLARTVITQSDIIKQHVSPIVAYDPAIDQILLRTSDLSIYSVPPSQLRQQCQCAGCVDEHSGVSKILQMSESERAQRFDAVKPLGMQPRGNYAMAVHWSDGHASSIYPYQQILKLAQPFNGRTEAFTKQNSATT